MAETRAQSRQTLHGRADIYNLTEDVGETTNVAKDHPEIVEKLMKQLEFAKQDIGYHGVIGENSRRKH